MLPDGVPLSSFQTFPGVGVGGRQGVGAEADGGTKGLALRIRH